MMAKRKPVFEVGQTVTLGKEEYRVVSTGLTVRGGRDTIGPPGVYGVVKLEHLASGKRINWLGVLLEKRIQEEQEQERLREKRDEKEKERIIREEELLREQENKSPKEKTNGRKRKAKKRS